MKWLVLTVGKPALPYARLGIAEYYNRIRAFAPILLEHVRPGPQVDSQILSRSKDHHRVLLDPRGQALDTPGMLAAIEQWQQAAIQRIAFIIGGPDGHSEALRRQADACWSFGPAVMQHELAAVVLLEQLYRLLTLQRGIPYHR